MDFLYLGSEITQNFTWQKSTFTNCIHQLEQATSKAQNKNTARHVWCLTTMNTFIEALSFLSQVSQLPSSCDTFSFFCNTVFETDKAEWSKCLETYGEPQVWSFDLWNWKVLHKEQTLSTVVLYIIINPYKLFCFQSNQMCYMSPLCTGYHTPKENGACVL